ncbi:unnamed protein product, partial [Strongylus vulgaris]
MTTTTKWADHKHRPRKEIVINKDRGTGRCQSRGEIKYIYATAKTVAEIRQLKGLNMCHFALALESEAYKDETSELEMLVCLFKFYEIPAHLREGTWKKARESLNSRVRRLRKTIRDKQTARVRAEARYVSSAPTWQECEDAS